MAQSFVLKVNDVVKNIASKETQTLLRNVLLVENPLSESLSESLAQTDNQGRKYSEFYADALIKAGDPADVFELTIAGDKQTATGKATRQALYNRMTINANRDAYSTSITKVFAESDDKTEKKSGKAEADVI
jgi:hypothetical protein